MSPLIPLLLLGGTVFVLTSRGRGGVRKDVAPPAPPPPVVPPALPPSTTDGKCILPEQKDLTNLPDDPFWNAYRFALLMDSDPKNLREFADSCDAVCQPTAAKALRDKASALEGAGVPTGYSPNGLPPLPGTTFTVPGLPTAIPVPTGYDPTGMWSAIPAGVLKGDVIPDSFPMPIPDIETSPDPDYPVDIPIPGVPAVSVEQKPKTKPDAPQKGIRSWAITQWWSNPLKAGQSPWSLAKEITGDGRRYPELMPANPEKATVGKPGSSGYTFVSFKIGERVRIPKGWNIYIDQTGHYDEKGTIYPADPAEPKTV